LLDALAADPHMLEAGDQTEDEASYWIPELEKQAAKVAREIPPSTTAAIAADQTPTPAPAKNRRASSPQKDVDPEDEQIDSLLSQLDAALSQLLATAQNSSRWLPSSPVLSEL
jgi:hypothetical protein